MMTVAENRVAPTDVASQTSDTSTWADAGQWQRKLEDGPFSRAIRYLVEHYEEQPSLAEVAEVAHLSPFHFERRFKRWAGVTPKQFTQFLTLGHAKEMLAESASVMEAAHEVGLSGGGRLHDLFVAVEAVTPGEFKRCGEGVRIAWDRMTTTFGDALLAITERGVCYFSFLDDSHTEDGVDRESRLDDRLSDLRQSWPRAEIAHDPAAVAPVAARLAAQLAGEGSDGANVGANGSATNDGETSTEGLAPVRLHLRGTNFQLQVWQALLEIPVGQAVSYGGLAASLGRPGAARAVAGAVAANPVAILIPCHRVIRSTGKMAGYRWGRGRKKALLGWESARRATATQ